MNEVLALVSNVVLGMDIGITVFDTVKLENKKNEDGSGLIAAGFGGEVEEEHISKTVQITNELVIEAFQQNYLSTLTMKDCNTEF